MNDLWRSNSFFDPAPTWDRPLEEEPDEKFLKSTKCVKYFDQNGYDLCPLEREFAKVNCDVDLTAYKGVHISIHRPWYHQEEKTSGYVLNHSMLLERKGYGGHALEQLKSWARMNPLIYKLINYKSKWGIDLSLDYVDEAGNCMELFHYEYDSFDYPLLMRVKKQVEDLVERTDFDEVAQDLLAKKDEWFNLEFFEQSKYKTDYFGLNPERFKMVGWQ